MKVAYLAHFTEGRGWANASENYVRSLVSVGVDVVCRPVVINQTRMPSKDIFDLCHKPLAGCTHVIQHTIPHHWDFSSKVKNIGLFVTETDNITYTHWENKIKCMDQVWVPNVQMQQELLPIETKLVPHATDISIYDREYRTPYLPEFQDKFVFYFIGENIKRKRLNAILTAYYTAFDMNDDVVLVIKTGRDGQPIEETSKEIQQLSGSIKNSLRLYAKRDLYPEMVLVPGNLSIDELYGLHQYGNCFVNATFGDAWNQPCFDALGFGNTIISPLIGGMKDYLNGCLDVHGVEVTKEIVFGADAFLPDLHTARECWYACNINDLVNKMRSVYDNDVRSKNEQHKNMAKRYSYENIGTAMLSLLEQ